MDFVGLMKTNPYVPLIAASDFLNCFGDTLLGWYHIWMATVASQKLSGATGQEKYFYEGKIESAKFFIDRTTSLVPAKCDILKNNDTGAMRISEEAFGI